MNITPLAVAASPAFQALALGDAIRLLSDKSGISFPALVAQLETNDELRNRCAEMVALAAEVTAESLSC
jgi:hypothetical protein